MDAIARAEIITVGTELLLGEVTDTNSSWLASRLADQGIDVYWSLRVGDNRARLEAAIRAALSRSDLVVLTGGLGPTDDDLTRETIAAVCGETPEVDPSLEAELRAWFSGRSRAMPERNLKQAWLIPSAEALSNPLGTAPGWLVRQGSGDSARIIVALPGPPRELMPMWLNQVVPRLRTAGSGLYRRTFRTYGIGESDIADLLDEQIRSPNPSVATYAKRDGVHVRVAAKAGTEAEARALARPFEEQVAALLGGHVWGFDDDELAELIVSRLTETGRTLASAEGPSGGLLMEAVSAVPGSEGVYTGGVLAWSAQAMGILGLPRPAGQGQSGAVLAGLMADAARDTFTADFGLATFETGRTGRPSEPAAASEVFIALTSDMDPVVRRLELPRVDGAWRRERILIAALQLFWSQIRR